MQKFKNEKSKIIGATAKHKDDVICSVGVEVVLCQ